MSHKQVVLPHIQQLPRVHLERNAHGGGRGLSGGDGGERPAKLFEKSRDDTGCDLSEEVDGEIGEEVDATRAEGGGG